MIFRAASFVFVAAAVGGCTLSAVTSVHETFPNEKNLIQECREYAGGDIQSIAVDMARQQSAGWKVKLTGYHHTNFLGILAADIVVCYEKRLAATSSPEIKPLAGRAAEMGRGDVSSLF